MEFADWLRVFDKTHVCWTSLTENNGHGHADTCLRYRDKGLWRGLSAAGGPNEPSFCHNPQYVKSYSSIIGTVYSSAGSAFRYLRLTLLRLTVCLTVISGTGSTWKAPVRWSCRYRSRT
jgi:hypothetical protein